MKNYISFEIAKQLKSIGFNEPCDIEKELRYPCPTKDEIVDWFIEKHGLLILIDYGYCDAGIDNQVEKFYYGVSVVEIGMLDDHGDILTHNDNGMYETRKDAIGRGIDMCIGMVFERMAKESILPTTIFHS